ncbi:MAG: serine endopeptidase [Gammaproteobacteria bacterium]|nr:serine endopeptidase [Gammaproteobacteria bacterium]
MANYLRLSEKWFNRGLWFIAFLFAYFLMGLGGVIVEDLPKIESKLSTEDFIDKPAKSNLTNQLKLLSQEETRTTEKLEQAKLQLQTAREDYRAAKQTFDAWVTTRNATQKSDQDRDLIARTTHLEQLRKKEREYLNSLEIPQKQLLDITQEKSKINRDILLLESNARTEFGSAQKKIELRVFIYRLIFVLPLLLVATYLFVKHRKKSYWPFVWGFILFSLFAFFVELVPYLPSYGGYVRYTVGVVVTLIVGKYSISGLQRYIKQQRELEQQPDSQRKKEIQYDLAFTRIAKGICPSCERSIIKDTDNFCQHCGIEMFDKCATCETRKITFSKFCFHCGKKTGAIPI